jgi:hypothetical protein
LLESILPADAPWASLWIARNSIRADGKHVVELDC